MADINLDIVSALFAKVFGYSSPAFDPQFSTVVGNTTNGIPGTLRRSTGVAGSPYYAKDANGREYFLPITVTYTDSNGELVSWPLPYPVMSISSKKTLIETALTERRGTVKELINIQDYEITIKGLIIGRTREFPQDDVAQLRDLYEQNVAVSISNPVTDIFLLRPDRNGSDQVVITSLKFPEAKGVKNVRGYEMTLVSDEPFNLISITN